MALVRFFNATLNATMLYLLQHLPGASRGVVRLLPDLETVTFLGLSTASSQLVSEGQLQKFAVGPPIESVHMSVINPDNVLHQQIIKMEALQGLPDLNEGGPLRIIDHAFNPSIERWIDGKFLFVSHKEGDSLDRLEFGWFNATLDGRDVDMASGFLTHPFYGLGPGPMTLPLDIDTTAHAGDARLLVVNSSLLFVAYSAFPARFHPTREGVVVLRANHATAALEMVDAYLLEPDWLTPEVSASTYQKNWAPFLFNGTVLYAQSLDPFVAVSVHERIERPNSPVDPAAPANNDTAAVAARWPSIRKAKIFSQTAAHAHWNEWGSMRGGTPGRLISRNRLLFFFHSRKFLPNNQRTTYFYGALITSAHPPFTPTHISRVPIYIKGLYEGAWDSIQFYDYVYYPTAWFLHSGETGIDREDCDYYCLLQHNATLVMGYQDGKGAAVVINLGKLFSTMVRPGERG